jgi:hypothetical protein
LIFQYSELVADADLQRLMRRPFIGGEYAGYSSASLVMASMMAVGFAVMTSLPARATIRGPGPGCHLRVKEGSLRFQSGLCFSRAD